MLGKFTSDSIAFDSKDLLRQENQSWCDSLGNTARSFCSWKRDKINLKRHLSLRQIHIDSDLAQHWPTMAKRSKAKMLPNTAPKQRIGVKINQSRPMSCGIQETRFNRCQRAKCVLEHIESVQSSIWEFVPAFHPLHPILLNSQIWDPSHCSWEYHPCHSALLLNETYFLPPLHSARVEILYILRWNIIHSNVLWWVPVCIFVFCYHLHSSRITTSQAWQRSDLSKCCPHNESTFYVNQGNDDRSH